MSPPQSNRKPILRVAADGTIMNVADPSAVIKHAKTTGEYKKVRTPELESAIIAAVRLDLYKEMEPAIRKSIEEKLKHDHLTCPECKKKFQNPLPCQVVLPPKLDLLGMLPSLGEPYLSTIDPQPFLLGKRYLADLREDLDMTAFHREYPNGSTSQQEPSPTAMARPNPFPHTSEMDKTIVKHLFPDSEYTEAYRQELLTLMESHSPQNHLHDSLRYATSALISADKRTQNSASSMRKMNLV